VTATGPSASPPRRRVEWPLVAAVAIVVAVLAWLWVGYGPIGGDPDRIYKPIKQILAESLRRGTLPFWTDRFGLGLPLVAESHVAAFYPPNWAAYGLLGLGFAYRLMMGLHHAALAASTYLYARRLGIAPWGSALSAISFTLCGFLAIHSSHEWAYHTLPFLTLALWVAEGYLADGRRRWLAGLALVFGAQLLLGHFQVQSWTAGLVVLTGLWRVAADRRPAGRLVGLGFGLGWGLAVAAVQLVPTWGFSEAVGQTGRTARELSDYAFPPAHLVELVFPRFFRELKGGPEDPYWWNTGGTTGYEACFYVGSVPLILAAVGLVAPGRRGVAPWMVLIPALVALATMPHWWPSGYDAVLRIPGLGLFRCPARYTAIASLGLALLAGRGLDRALSARRFWIGILIAMAVGIALGSAAIARANRPEFRGSLGDATLGIRLGLGLLGWSTALVALGVWRSGRAGAWLPVGVAAIELGLLYHTASPDWGWEVDLPGSSPVLTGLAATPGARRVAGQADNLPIRAGLAAAVPYIGFRLPPPHPFLTRLLRRDDRTPVPAEVGRWLRRYGVTHGVWYFPVALGEGERVETKGDPALDLLAYIPRPRPEHLTWRVVTLAEPLPEARTATSERIAPDEPRLIEGKTRSAIESEAWFLRGVEPGPPASPWATSARVVDWDGRSGSVEHDGACDLILTRTFDPGWRARLDDGPEVPVWPVDGGIQAIRLDGSGATRVAVRYEPPWFRPAAAVSLVALLAAVVGLSIPGRRPAAPPAPEPPEAA